MPMPEGSALSRGFSPILTSMAQSFIPDFLPVNGGVGGFIHTLVMPTLRVGAKTGSFNIWSRGDFLRLEAKKLANAEPAPIGGFATTYGTYNTEHYGIASNWTAEDLADARQGGFADAELTEAKTRYVTGQILLRREVNTAAMYQTSANWTQTNAGVASGPTTGQFLRWNATAADPVADVVAWTNALYDATGIRPNTMIIPRPVWSALRTNASLIDRIKYGGTMDRPTQVTLAQLKALFEIDNILVPDAQYNSAPEDLTPVYTTIWNNNMWIGYVAAQPNKRTPSAGYAFAWDGASSGAPGGTGAGPQSFGASLNPEGIYIREYSTDRPAARYVEAEMWWKPYVTAADVGMTLTAVLA